MTQDEYAAAIYEANREMRDAMAVLEAIQVQQRKAKDRLDAAEGRLRALWRTEVKS